MEQDDDVGTKSANAVVSEVAVVAGAGDGSPFDWAERLRELAASLDKTPAPDGFRAVVGLDSPTLTALAEMIDWTRGRASTRYRLLRDIDRAMCEHVLSDGLALQEIGTILDGAKRGGYL